MSDRRLMGCETAVGVTCTPYGISRAQGGYVGRGLLDFVQVDWKIVVLGELFTIVTFGNCGFDLFV